MAHSRAMQNPAETRSPVDNDVALPLEQGRAVQGATPVPDSHSTSAPQAPPEMQREIGGPSGPEPTRYGDWERKGRCIDF